MATRRSLLTPVILATQEAEISRTDVPSQPYLETLYGKNPSQKRKKRAGGVAQGEGPEFKSQYQGEKKKLWRRPVSSVSRSSKRKSQLQSSSRRRKKQIV
jgi:hypothetical protein